MEGVEGVVRVYGGGRGELGAMDGALSLELLRIKQWSIGAVVQWIMELGS